MVSIGSPQSKLYEIDLALEPFVFAEMCWPDVIFFPEQVSIIESVRDNDETYVKAGNALGKDFVAGFIALWWFCSRRPARVVTTSVKMDQLEDVLWGEIRRFNELSRVQLPIQYNHMKIRATRNDGTFYPNAELVGQVSSSTEGLLGRHSTGGFKPVQGDIPRTLVIFDEASGIDDNVYKSTQTWAHRKLMIGNPFPCENFYRKGCDAGDVPRKNKLDGSPNGYHRKVLKITAWDSPNVRLGMTQKEAGIEPTDEILVPGAKSYSKLQENLLLWDPILQTVGLHAEFYEGPEQKLYPLEWRKRSADISRDIRVRGSYRRAKAIGIDPAEGGDKTAMCAVDDYGVIDLVSKKTPNTSVITGEAIAFMKKHGVEPENVCFDRGGGGKQHADRLRLQGYNVRTIAFGEVITSEPRRGMRPFSDKMEVREDHYTYFNRRAEMYGELRQLLDPSLPGRGFGIPDYPEVYQELQRQMKPIPLTYDAEGRMRLLPKHAKNADDDSMTLEKLIGCSPDELDSLALAVHGMLHKAQVRRAGAV